MKNLKQLDYCKNTGALATFDAEACSRCSHFSAAAGNCPGIGSRVEMSTSGIHFRICLALTLLASSIMAGYHDRLLMMPGISPFAGKFLHFCFPDNPMLGWGISIALAMAAAGLCVQTGMTTLTAIAGYNGRKVNRV